MFNTGTYNFTLNQGSTLRKTFTWTACGDPVDLTGWTGRSQFRTTIQSPTAALDMTSLNGGIIIDPLVGSITMFASAGDTSLLTADGYVYDLELINPSGDVDRLVQGYVTMSPGVTR